MKIDNSFSKRVVIARTVIGATQEQLADMVGIVRRQIAAYEAGTSKPREKVLQNLAAALGTTTEWLSHGEGKGPDVSSIKKTITVHQIPVFTYDSGDFVSNTDIIYDKKNAVDFIPAPEEASENAFAIIATGNSMLSSSGISFPDGSVITIDPDVRASSGDFVLCSSGGDGVTFKQLIIERGVKYLYPLNPQYPAVQPENLRIIGVAIHSQMFLPYNDVETDRHSLTVNYGGRKNDCLHLCSQTHPVPHELIEAVEQKLDLIINMLSNKKPT